MKSPSVQKQVTSTEESPHRQLEEMKKQLLADGVEFFVNSVLEPTVHIPTDGYQKDWPVDSQRVHDLLNMTFYELNDGHFLKSTSREMMLSIMREECRDGVRRLSENESARSENNPIVQGILYLMNKKPTLDVLTSVLGQDLRDLQDGDKISPRPPIPVFTNIFSRQLNRLVPVFKGMGIDVTVRHEVDGSHCKLERLPAFQKEPSDDSAPSSSDQSSDPNSITGTNLGIPDGADGGIRTDIPREPFQPSEQSSSVGRTAERREGGAK